MVDRLKTERAHPRRYDVGVHNVHRMLGIVGKRRVNHRKALFAHRATDHADDAQRRGNVLEHVETDDHVEGLRRRRSRENQR